MFPYPQCYSVWTMAHRAAWRCGVPGCHCLPTVPCSCTSTGGALGKRALSTAWTGSAAPWRWAWACGGVVGAPHESQGSTVEAAEDLPWSVPPQMHLIHMNTRYQSMGEALRHPDGLAVLAVLLAVREGPRDSWQGGRVGLCDSVGFSEKGSMVGGTGRWLSWLE